MKIVVNRNDNFFSKHNKKSISLIMTFNVTTEKQIQY